MILLLLACGGQDDATTSDALPAVDCATLSGGFPEARGDHAGVFDAATGRFVFFGGDVGVPENCESRTAFTDETWTWVPSCEAWHQIQGDAPSKRGRHVAALDTAGHRMIVHGGRFRDGTSGDYTLRDDTWALDLGTDTWTKLSSGGPPGRSSHAGDIVGGKLVVYGGNDSTNGLSFSPMSDTWVLDLATSSWTELDAQGDIGARLFHAAAGDGAHRLFVYGGGEENAFIGPFFGDLWELDLDTAKWTQLHDGGGKAPRARIQANLAYDAATDRLLLFGGHDDGTMGNNNQLWSFDLATQKWTEEREGDVENASANGFCDFPVDFTVIDETAPERRSAAAMAVAPGGELWVMGGKSDCGSLDDVWHWTGTTWENAIRATSGESCPRAYEDCSTLCF